MFKKILVISIIVVFFIFLILPPVFSYFIYSNFYKYVSQLLPSVAPPQYSLKVSKLKRTFTGILLQNINISTPAKNIFSADEIRINLSPANLFILKSPFVIKISNPKIQINIESDFTAKTNSFKYGFLSFIIKDGIISFKNLTIDSLNGKIDLFLRYLKVDVSSGDFENLKCKFYFGKKYWKSFLKISNLSPKMLSIFLPATSFSGNIDITGSLLANYSFGIIKNDISCDIKKINITLKNWEKPVEINGKIQIIDKKLFVRKISLNTENNYINIFGEVNNLFSRWGGLNFPNLHYKLNIISRNFELKSLKPLINLPYVKGKTDLFFKVSGTKQNCNLIGKFDFTDSNILSIPVERIEFIGLKEKDIFTIKKLDVYTLDDKISTNGRIYKKTALQITADKLNLKKWGKNNNIQLTDGNLAIDLKLQKTNDLLTISGNWNIKNLKWYNQKSDFLTGKLRVVNDKLKLIGKTKNNTFKYFAEGSISKNTFFLKNFKISSSEGFNLFSSGFIKDNNCSLKFNTSGIRLNRIPVFNKYSIHGIISINGEISNTLFNPVLNGTVTIKNFQNKYTLTTGFSYTNSMFNLNNINMQDSITGDISYKKVLYINLNLKDLPSEVINPNSDQPFKLSGKITANIHPYQWNKGKIFIDIYENEKKIRFLIVKEEEKIKKLLLNLKTKNKYEIVSNYRGIITPDNRLEINGTTSFKKFEKLSVQTKISNTFDVILPTEKQELKGTTKIYSDYLKINKYYQNPFSCIVYFNKNSISLKEINFEKIIKGNLQIDFSKNDIRGLVNIENYSLQKFIKEILNYRENIDGRIFGNINIKGKISNPLVVSYIEVRDGVWNKNFIFTGVLNTSIKNHIMNIFNSNLESNQIGRFNISGKIDLINKKLNLLSSFKEIDFKNINIFKKNYIQNGKISGKILATENFNSPKIKIITTANNVEINANRIIKVDNIETNLDIKDKNISIHNITANLKESKIIIEDTNIEVNSPKKIKVVSYVKLRNMNILNSIIFADLKLDGMLEKDRFFEFEGNLNIPTLWLNKQNYENINTKVFLKKKSLIFTSPQITQQSPFYETSGQIIFYRNKIIFKNLTLTEKIKTKKKIQSIEHWNLDGKISDTYIQLSLKGNNIDFQNLVDLFDIETNINGNTNFILTARGEPKSPTIIGSFECSNGEFYYLNFDYFGGNFSIKKNILTLTNINLSKGNALDLKIDGSFPLKKQRLVTKKLGIKVNLNETNLKNLLSQKSPIKFTRGTVKGNLEINPNFINGNLNINQADFTSKYYLTEAKNINIDLILKDNTLSIQQFEFDCANDKVIGDGKIIFEPYDVTEKIQPAKIDLNFKTVKNLGIKIVLPQLPIKTSFVFTKIPGLKKFFESYSTGSVYGNVNIKGNIENPVIKADLNINNSHFSYPPPIVEKTKQKIFQNPIYDFNLKFKGGVFENDYVNANVDGNLKITGKPDEIKVDGFFVSQSGQVSYLATTFEIKYARLEIIPTQTQDKKIEHLVYLEGEAYKTQAFYDVATGKTVEDNITMKISKSIIGEITPVFSSRESPNLSSDKVLARATGLEEDFINDPVKRDIQLRKSLIQIFDSTLATPLAKNILRKLKIPVDIKVTYEEHQKKEEKIALTDEATFQLIEGLKHTIGTQITPKFYTGYGLKIESFHQNKLDLRHEIEVAYKLHPQLILKAISELDTERILGRQPDKSVNIQGFIRFGQPKKKESKK